jgi:DNA (cytosine-5)-methyltransferase 1
MSLGFEQAGFDVLAAVEYDPVHAAAHQFNFPDTEMVCRDIRRISGVDVLNAAAKGWQNHERRGRWPGKVDVVFGGPSCQGFSTIGKRIVDDDRNQLLIEFVRLVEEISPQAFCMENVPGLLHESFSELREYAFARLRHAGYRMHEDVRPVNAVDFGVPQNRKRIVLIGIRDNDSTDLIRTTTEHLTVADAFEGLAEPSRYPELRDRDWSRLTPDDTKVRRNSKGSYARFLSSVDRDPNDKSRERSWDHLRITNSLLTQHSSTLMARFSKTPQGQSEPVSHYFKLAINAPARTLRAGTGRERGAFTSPRPIHPTEPRVITAREAARLHSFPDWFRFNVTNWHGHRQIGNSVPPLLARAAAVSLSTALGYSPKSNHEFEAHGPRDVALLRQKMNSAPGAVADELPRRRILPPRKLVLES